MADLLGWQVVLMDGRKNHATKQRFGTVNQILVGPADSVLEGVEFDPFTIALLMTHNFEYEAIILEKLQSESLPYIGILGPKKKTQKLIERLEGKGVAVSQENLYAPLGLDIGAEGSEEIALSVLSEIRTALNRKKPIHLREKDGPIHG
jgi:xanthine/CO dehydrogenase XdhC/CoxF family maturation factor